MSEWLLIIIDPCKCPHTRTHHSTTHLPQTPSSLSAPRAATDCWTSSGASQVPLSPPSHNQTLPGRAYGLPRAAKTAPRLKDRQQRYSAFNLETRRTVQLELSMGEFNEFFREMEKIANTLAIIN